MSSDYNNLRIEELQVCQFISLLSVDGTKKRPTVMKSVVRVAIDVRDACIDTARVKAQDVKSVVGVVSTELFSSVPRVCNA